MPIQEDTEYDKARAERDAREKKRHDLLCSLLAKALIERGPSLRYTLSECKPYTIRELASAVLTPDDVIEAVYEAAEKEIETQVKKRVDEARAKMRAKAAPVPKAEPAPSRKAAPPAPKATPKAPAPTEPTPSLDTAIYEAAMAGELPDSFAAGDAGKLSPLASRGVIAGALDRLVSAGKLTRAGKGRGTKYRLAAKPAPKPTKIPPKAATKQTSLLDDESEDLEDQLERIPLDDRESDEE